MRYVIRSEGEYWDVVKKFEDELTPDEWVATCCDESIARKITDSTQTEKSECCFVLAIDIDESISVWVYSTYEAAKQRLFEYVSKYWASEIDDDYDMPDDPDEAIDRYFDEVENEHFTLERKPIMEDV